MFQLNPRKAALAAAVLFTIGAGQAHAGDWVARHGMTDQSYQQAFDKYLDQGFRLVDLSAYTVGGKPRFAAVWWKQSPTSPISWVSHHGMTSAQYQKKFDHYLAKGYRLIDVDGYAQGGKARYAAIWQKRRGGGQWQARHGLTPGEYQQTFNQLKAQGYRPAKVSAFNISGKVRFAAIWTRGGGRWQARHGLTAAQYQATFNKLTAKGYRLIDVSGYRQGGKARYAAIWIKTGSMAWQARHGLTSAQYQQSFNQLSSNGYKLVQVNGTGLPGGARYAAIWWKL